MHITYKHIILWSFSLLLLSTCDMKFSNTSAEHQGLSSSRLGEMAVAEDRKVSKRNGRKGLPMPGSQINYDKVDSMMKEGNLSPKTYNTLIKKADGIEKINQKLKELLQKQSVINDKELLFSVHGMLSNEYLRLYSKSGQKDKEYLNKAIKHSNSAISMFEDDPKYKADLADCYSILTSAYVFEKKYDKAISLMKYLIEDFQDIGYGPYRNWFPSLQVRWLNNLAHMKTYNLKSGKTQEIVNYLSMISGKYKNEIGISAQMELVRHYITTNKEEKAKKLISSIKNRVSSLDNQAFKVNKWDKFETQMKRLKELKSHKHH